VNVAVNATVKIEILESENQTLKVDLHATKTSLQVVKTDLKTTQEKLDTANRQLAFFKRHFFGEKSEKHPLPASAGTQMSLFADQVGPLVDSEPAPAETVTSYQRRSKVRKDEHVLDEGLRFDANVPVEVIEVDCPELQGPEADQYEVIRYEETHKLAQRPGAYVVLCYRRPVLRKKGRGDLITTPAPEAVLEKSIADVSLLAGILVDKFVYHLPLYRQHQRMEQAGVKLSRTTPLNLGQRAIDLLEPIVNAMWRKMLLDRILAMDETPIKAGRKSKGKMKTGYFWPVYGESNEVVFHFAESRGLQVIKELLGKEFKGTLLTDGHKPYATFAKDNSDIIHAGCWVHTRRYFERSLGAEPEAANEALVLIGRLFEIEKEIRAKNLQDEAKLDYRTVHSSPAVESFWAWCEKQCYRLELEPSNPLSKALKYARARVAALKVFLTDPDVPLDTNHLERSLRPIPMGRRNWLFCWSEMGAKQVAIIQSLLVSCKLQGVDPTTYLIDVLQRVSMHPAKEAWQLAPAEWKERFSQNPLKSALGQ
jgi:transposase